jgi:hypothetical protein
VIVAFAVALVCARVAGAQQKMFDPPQVPSQRQVETISGVVMDPSGAVVRSALVKLLAGPASLDSPVVGQTQSGPTGGFRLRASPGTYTAVVEAPGFARFQSALIRLGPSTGLDGTKAIRGRTLNVRLQLDPDVERVDVAEEFGGDGSGGALLLRGRTIQEMPQDPTALLDELLGLAGSRDAELFVGGFSGGKLPSRDSIRDIRINPNPYSAQNDINPVNGVIQVTTKPGTDQLHGSLYLYGDDSALNAGNPFAPGQPGYYADGSGGSLSGSLRRRTSYYAGWDQMNLEMNSAIDAQTLDANFNPAQVNLALRSPQSMLNASFRLDLRAGTNSTVTIRYVFDRDEQINGGIGQLALASQGFNNDTDTQTLQVSNSQVIGLRIVNETRFQYIRTRTAQDPVSATPAIVVEGAFTGGGNDQEAFSDHQDRYELQNYMSIVAGRHFLNLGGRLRVARDANHSEANFSGEFIFASLAAYQATMQGAANGESFAQIAAAGGGASQFNLNSGNPTASVAIADAGLFVQDDWKVRRNLTLCYGMRFETQNYIAVRADWAPRLGFSWGLGGGDKPGGKSAAPRFVLHGGAGVFYRRFTSASALQIERQNGISQQEYVVESPQFCPAAGTATGSCPGIPSVAALAAQSAAPTMYVVSPNFEAPYYIGESVSLDRKLGHHGTASVTYLNNRGVHTRHQRKHLRIRLQWQVPFEPPQREPLAARQPLHRIRLLHAAPRLE